MFISAYERTAVFLIELGNFRILMVILQSKTYRYKIE
jgi:hypothetical protein